MTRIIGVDEVGRGPLAGPVLAVAVQFQGKGPIGVKDSKSLSEKKRQALADEIKANTRWAYGVASVIEIDRVNILQASLLAMQRAVIRLNPGQGDEVLVDGNKLPHLSVPARAIVKGDSLIPEISAASIVAKVMRDHLMMVLDKHYPQYGFGQHKGYPTKTHLAALNEHGPLPCHRKTFGPVRRLLVGV